MTEKEAEFNWNNFYGYKSLRSRNWLVLYYARLIPLTRRRLFPKAINPSDMDQAAIIALIKAIEDFNPERGVAFTTLANTYIRYCLIEHIKKENLLGTREKYLSEVPEYDGEAEAGIETVVDPSASPEEVVLTKHCRSLVRSKVDDLPPPLRDIIVRRFWKREKLREIAASSGGTMWSVYSKEKQALRRLKDSMPSDIFTR